MRILIVDDNSDNRDMLSFILAANGYEILSATNGLEAVEQVKESLPDLILMDVIMPVMDGFQATAEIRDFLGATHVPILFLTGLSDDDTLSKCLSVGGDDFLYKPITHQVLTAKIKAHQRIRDLTLQLDKKNRQLVAAQNLSQREQNIAKELFARVMGENLPDCDNTRSFMSSASTFNGDILLTAKAPSGSLYVLMADFTGHGLPAAVGTLPMSQMFFEAVGQCKAVSDIARKMNRALESFLPDEMFAATTILELNKLGTRVTIWTGALPEILVYDEHGNLTESIKSQHLALGIASDDNFDEQVLIRQLHRGERLLLYTDGLVEAKNKHGERFGAQRLTGHFQAGLPDVFQQIVDDCLAFQSGTKQLDDISIIEVRCVPVSQETKQPTKVSPKDRIPWTVTMALGPESLRHPPPVTLLTDMITVSPGTYNYKDSLQTVLTELFSNALEHGVLGLSSKLKGTEDGYIKYYEERMARLMELDEGQVHLTLDYKFENEQGVLTLVVSDSGKGFEFEKNDSLQKNDESGRGLLLIRQLTDELVYSDKGTKVRVKLLITFED